jgi:hypothetical protein
VAAAAPAIVSFLMRTSSASLLADGAFGRTLNRKTELVNI